MPNTGLFGLWAVVPTGIVIEPVPVNIGFALKVRVIGSFKGPLPKTSPTKFMPVFNS